jgi:hypothetical protein
MCDQSLISPVPLKVGEPGRTPLSRFGLDNTCNKAYERHFCTIKSESDFSLRHVSCELFK